jgi:hypothetical protein
MHSDSIASLLGGWQLRAGVLEMRADAPSMGMGKMRKALQSRKKWAVSEKRLRTVCTQSLPRWLDH